MKLVEARSLSLSAQGISGQALGGKVTWPKLAREIDRLQLLQIDSVNVISRSHYLPLFSRLGAYDHSLLDAHTLAATTRHVFECWAHEASLVPMHLHPLMRWRMERAKNGNGIYRHFDNFARDEKAFLKNTLKFIASNGPTKQSQIPGAGKSSGGWWGWSKGKTALEVLFDQGLITTSRRDDFERIYDLTENVISSEILAIPTPSEEETFAELMLLSAQALGVGTEADLRDYFRLPLQESRAALKALVSDKRLEQVEVEGWAKPGFIVPGTKIPRKATGTALLSPFDPIVWNRERAERLFNFIYRLEIYTPKEKRKYGYYVLPFMMNGELVGRVCLKADRAGKTLLVNAAHVEDMQDDKEVAENMASELQRMSKWLGLTSVAVAQYGNLAKVLAKHF